MTKEIDEATSKRICSHMNLDHASTVHGLVTTCVNHETKVKISDAKLKSVSLNGLTVIYVTCSGDVCERKTSFVPFEPPLTSVNEARPRMIEIHNRVCAPQLVWLVTKPFAAEIIVVVSLIAFAVLVLGVDNLAKIIQKSSRLNTMISAIFGSASFFSKAVLWSWYVTILGHGTEAIWVAYQCQSTLKLQTKPTLLWFLLVCCTGFPVTKEFFTLWKVQVEAKKAKKQS